MHGIYHLVGRDRLIRNHCWERQSHAASCLLPGRVALGLEHFLTKREKALQPVPAILLCFGTSSPVPGLMCTFFVLLEHVAHWPSGMSPPFWISNPYAGRGVLYLQQKRGSCTISLSYSGLWSKTRWPQGMDAGCWSCSCCVSLWGGKRCSIQSLCKFPLSWWPWHLQTMRWVDTLVLLLLVGGNTCHLLHNCHNETTAEGKKSPLREHVTEGWMWLSWEWKYKPELVREK